MPAARALKIYRDCLRQPGQKSSKESVDYAIRQILTQTNLFLNLTDDAQVCRARKTFYDYGRFRLRLIQQTPTAMMPQIKLVDGSGIGVKFTVNMGRLAAIALLRVSNLLAV